MRKVLLITLGLLIVAPALSGCNPAFLKGIAKGMADEYNRGSSRSSSTGSGVEAAERRAKAAESRIEELERVERKAKRVCQKLENAYWECRRADRRLRNIDLNCESPSC